MNEIHLLNDKIDKLDENVNRRLDNYNSLLEIHIEGVNTLKKLHEQNEKRIEKLEEPVNTFLTLRKYVIGVGTTAGAVLAVAKLLNYL